MGNPDGEPGSLLLPGPALTVAHICQLVERRSLSICECFCVCLSGKMKINTESFELCIYRWKAKNLGELFVAAFRHPAGSGEAPRVSLGHLGSLAASEIHLCQLLSSVISLVTVQILAEAP